MEDGHLYVPESEVAERIASQVLDRFAAVVTAADADYGFVTRQYGTFWQRAAVEHGEPVSGRRHWSPGIARMVVFDLDPDGDEGLGDVRGAGEAAIVRSGGGCHHLLIMAVVDGETVIRTMTLADLKALADLVDPADVEGTWVSSTLSVIQPMRFGLGGE
jgi:hypothetical protein